VWAGITAEKSGDMKRVRRVAAALAFAAAVTAVSAAPAGAETVTNIAVCRDGGYKNYSIIDRHPFENQAECMAAIVRARIAERHGDFDASVVRNI
jgi:hypothetical protein